MNLLVLLLENPNPDSSPWSMPIMMLSIFVVFYFFMIRPQVKKQKETKKFREDLKKGSQVVTTGGIYGKISEIKENIVILEVEDKMKLKVDVNAIIKDAAELQNQK